MNIARSLPKSVRLLGSIFIGILGLILLVVASARHDPGFSCLTVSNADGSTAIVDVRFGNSAVVPAVVPLQDVALNIPSPDGEQSMYVIWAPNPGHPPYQYTHLAMLSIGTRTNPLAIPLENVYLDAATGPYFNYQWTPDGKLLYLWTSQDGSFHMSHVDANGANKETYPLTDLQRFLSNDDDSVWSADGEYFATTTIKRQNNVVNIWSASDLHLVDTFIADGGAFASQWSHSGHRLFYTANSKVFPFVIASLDSPSAIMISDPQVFDQYQLLWSFGRRSYQVLWSPDDSWILVVGVTSGLPSFEFRADGKLQQVFIGSILNAMFDEQKLILQVYPGYGLGSQWNVVDISTDAIEHVVENIFVVRRSPKNPHRFAIAWRRTPDDINVDVMDAEGQNRETIFTFRGQMGDGESFVPAMEWSPDGNTILLNWRDAFQYHLSLLTADGTFLKEFDNSLGWYWNWKWLQKGHILAYVDNQNGQFLLKTFDVTTGQQQIIAEKMKRLVIENNDPQTDLFFGFYWQDLDGKTGVDVYDTAGNRIYRVLTPNLPNLGVYDKNLPPRLYRSPDGHFVLASNLQFVLSFLYADYRMVSVSGTKYYSSPKIRWSNCDPYDDGNGKTP